MTEVIKIPPFETCYQEIKTFPGYDDKRGVEDIERELRKIGIRFSFAETLKDLRANFPKDEKIKIFESGCGFANTSKDISQIANGLSIPVQTTAITMAEEHIPADPANQKAPDDLLVGTLGNHQKKGTIDKGFHFIIDFYGPLWYEAAVGYRYPQYTQEGEITLPIYRKIAKGGALIMMLMRSMEPDLFMKQCLQEYEVFRRMSVVESRFYLQDEGFSILEQKKRYVLMRKEKDFNDLIRLVNMLKGANILPLRGVSFLPDV